MAGLLRRGGVFEKQTQLWIEKNQLNLNRVKDLKKKIKCYDVVVNNFSSNFYFS